VLHLDLHPLNVIIGRQGPVVIDWTGACRGDPVVDVALAWVLMVAGEVPAGRVLGTILGRARSVLVNSFVRGFEVEADAVKQSLGEVVAWKTSDPHMSPSEQVRMWRVVEEFGRPAPA
jgi:aminoglycoside phosphotransferase (APT) family kinase protein